MDQNTFRGYDISNIKIIEIGGISNIDRLLGSEDDENDEDDGSDLQSPYCSKPNCSCTSIQLINCPSWQQEQTEKM